MKSSLSNVYYYNVNFNRYLLSFVSSLSNKNKQLSGFHERYMSGRHLNKGRWAERNSTSYAQCIISSKHSAKNLIVFKKSREDHLEKITYIFSQISNLEDF